MGFFIPRRRLVDTSISYRKGLHRGHAAGLPGVDADLIAANIRYGTTVFGILGTMVTWVYDLLAQTGKGAVTAPMPIRILTITNLDAGDGGQTKARSSDVTSLMPTIAETPENSMFLIDDCEAAWTEYAEPATTVTLDNVVFQIGSGSVKIDSAVGASTGRMATQAKGATDLTAYGFIRMWIRATITINSNDLHFLLDDTPACVTPIKSLNIGALVANTWTQVSLPIGDASGLGAVISYGIEMLVDKGAFILNVDQIRATKGA